MSKTVVVTILASGEALGKDLANKLDARHDARTRDFEDVVGHIASVFVAGNPMVVIGSSGIIIRALAPHLAHKTSDAPVVAVSPDGSVAIPLLGGHHGANDLARSVSKTIGAEAAITTAGDVVFGVALDAPPEGLILENPLDAKAAMVAILEGASVQISGQTNWLVPLVSAGANLVSASDKGPLIVHADGAEPLVYRRQSYVLGVGCARGCDPDHMIGFVAKSLATAGISEGEIAAVHSIDVKADEAAVHALAAHLNVPARFHTAAVLEAQTARLANPSDVVFAEVGCHGVAEAAALVAAGPNEDLTVEKLKSETATMAVARLGPAGSVGRSRGALSVIGIGHGDTAWRTGEAGRLVSDADELVGYSLYLDLLGPAAKGKVRKDFALGEEEARCRYALEAAGEGRNVALICSGDGGIFAMGALVMELLDRPQDAGGVSDAARRVAITHAPGISALQAASARCGAILGHDFCAISLSDLLTPREVILKRLKAASEGDFVIAFYNPVSRRRRDLLAIARDMLLEHRPPDCPVILASNLGRPEEKLKIISLADLEVDDVDMLTIVVIGSSDSRVVQSGDRSAGAAGNWVYTPRGYSKKLEAAS